ncbi:hypothetical protein ACFV3E_41085 [Streptomyces sp. NPDC059718]
MTTRGVDDGLLNPHRYQLCKFFSARDGLDHADFDKVSDIKSVRVGAVERVKPVA